MHDYRKYFIWFMHVGFLDTSTKHTYTNPSVTVCIDNSIYYYYCYYY